MLQSVTRWLGMALWAAKGLLAGLTTPQPRPRDLAERLATMPSRSLPLAKRVAIYWDEHQIPFIEAESDRDLAVALGLVHAHLRLGQLELLRRVSQGRLAEILGPLAVEMDHALRILDYGRSVPSTVAILPEETRCWLEGFVAGINHHLAQAKEPPPEFAFLGIVPEPWRIEDVLTVGRLAATDVSWLVWFRLLALRGASDWPAAWRQLVETAISPLPDPGHMASGNGSALENALLKACRSGSNAWILSAARSTTGAPLMAADPHVGLMQPNAWLAAGYRSPSHHAVGLMLPGLPFIAIGRNPWIAWAGTNLHASSSELVDVSVLPQDAFRQRRERIAVRWGRDREITIRETAFGPVVSDAPPLRWPGPEILALRWIGHRASDEITAMLRANRARDWDAFREALEGFALPGLTMLCAERSGRMGRVMAAHLPARPPALPACPFPKPDALAPWEHILTAKELPSEVDPRAGYLVSANEKPQPSDMLVGFFFSPDDRYRRIRHVIERQSPMDLSQAMELQRDVYHQPAADFLAYLQKTLAAIAKDWPVGSMVGRLAAALVTWDANYRADSSGALAFELLLYHLARDLVPPATHKAYETSWQARTLLARDIGSLPEDKLAAALRRALPAAARRFVRFVGWGSLHRLRLAHPLAAVPGIGKRFVYGDFPAEGSSETVLKTAHPLTDRRHAANYGATARMICDLSNADNNYVVLLGGQDGWPGSTTAVDQVTLWRRGGYAQLPLTPEAARARACRVTELVP